MSLIARLFRGALYLALLGLVSYSTILTSEPDVKSPEVRLEQGTVRGIEEGGIEYFRGVRYALDTANEGRFRRPRPIWENLSYKFPVESIQVNRTLSWQGVYDASFFAPSCPQFVVPKVFGGWAPPLPAGRLQEVVSEDCLHVNIARPPGISIHKPLPVFVWIYGGAWIMGADFLYDPKTLMQASLKKGEPIIVVTLNYRVGAFGLLAGPAVNELAAEGDADLNTMLWDQRTALRWVKRNIAQFGGDPDHITLGGESAGAVSSMYQMLANDADREHEDLFHAVILQSGGAFPGSVSATNYRHRDEYNQLLATTPCAAKVGPREQIACLRGLSTASMMAANTRSVQRLLGILNEASWQTQFFFPWFPTQDPYFVPESAYERVTRGKYLDIPILAGNTLDEGTLFTPTNIQNSSMLFAWIRRGVLSTEGLDVSHQYTVIDKILQAYPDDPVKGSPSRADLVGKKPEDRLFAPNETNQYKRAAAILGDLGFVAPTRYLLERHSAAHQGHNKTFPIWSYTLSEPAPGAPAHLGVPHAVDNDYLFKPSASYLFLRPPTDFRVPGSRWASVAEALASSWVSFVNHHTPNGRGAMSWPSYSTRPSPGIPKRANLNFQFMNSTVETLTARHEVILDTFIHDEEVRHALAY
ncbi:Acetylcholinesterase/Butyrylcholinesterase [Ceraceosorus bombacis]|uniref:Carboxylic ester hydrolase n=1 Tax=Ceraceosorus bombacis TaxID=401625 RepID=A0A0P1BLA6_9BASI|nr:Acetylcholinesterase/Butyrylcholinesterase [Ceraceosorus bombacis]